MAYDDFSKEKVPSDVVDIFLLLGIRSGSRLFQSNLLSAHPRGKQLVFIPPPVPWPAEPIPDHRGAGGRRQLRARRAADAVDAAWGGEGSGWVAVGGWVVGGVVAPAPGPEPAPSPGPEQKPGS
jgi:hypothetical protein